MQQTSECFHLVVEFCAGSGAGAGQASVAVVQAGRIVSVGTTLLQHRQEGHVKKGSRNSLEMMNNTIQGLISHSSVSFPTQRDALVICFSAVCM